MGCSGCAQGGGVQVNAESLAAIAGKQGRQQAGAAAHIQRQPARLRLAPGGEDLQGTPPGSLGLDLKKAQRFRSQMMRSPSSVSQGAMISSTLVSRAMISASPPVAMTFIFGPSSARKRATMPSTRET